MEWQLVHSWRLLPEDLEKAHYNNVGAFQGRLASQTGCTGPCSVVAVPWQKSLFSSGNRLTSLDLESYSRCFCLSELDWSCTHHGLSSSGRNFLCTVAVDGDSQGIKHHWGQGLHAVTNHRFPACFGLFWTVFWLFFGPIFVNFTIS